MYEDKPWSVQGNTCRIDQFNAWLDITNYTSGIRSVLACIAPPWPQVPNMKNFRIGVQTISMSRRHVRAPRGLSVFLVKVFWFYLQNRVLSDLTSKCTSLVRSPNFILKATNPSLKVKCAGLILL